VHIPYNDCYIINVHWYNHLLHNYPLFQVQQILHKLIQMYNEIPKIQSQVESIFSIIDDITDDTTGDNSPPSKATLVGHSYGTAIMSWMVQSKPERISGCVFLGKSPKLFLSVLIYRMDL
jgi:hypothetical protein